jgi:hypothetical protein
MKEILTKRFWQNVKKTFDEALEDSPPKSGDSAVPELPPSPEASPNPEMGPSVADVAGSDCDNGS